MEIVYAEFEKPLFLHIHGVALEIRIFKKEEQGLVSFGIEAPRHVMINREEVWQEKKRRELSDAIF